VKEAFPHLEDPDGIAGGNTDAVLHGKALPTRFGAGAPMGNSPASPPGENKWFNASANRTSYSQGDQLTDPHPDDEIENRAVTAGLPDEEDFEAPDVDFLRLVREAEAQSALYLSQVNQKAWAQSLRAFHQEHFVGSKYTKPDWRNRSKFFRPKTRSSVRKDMAAVGASLFNNMDAVQCLPGNESDTKQRAAAAIMQELVNYRTDRTSGKAAIPWMQVAMGARQDSLLTGICVTKQSWKLKLRKLDKPEKTFEEGEDGVYAEQTRDVWVPEIDRPDVQLIPPENIAIDPAADWTDPIQSSSYLIIKWPMQIDDIKRNQNIPLNPWKEVSEEVLRASVDVGTFNTAAIRRARESELDRLNMTQTGTNFQIVWVYEVFMKHQDEDYTFFSVGGREYLTDPKRVRNVYPEQFGERPLVFGVGSLEAHRLFPMAPVESWQMMQLELNDIVNLTLDAVKQNVMPVTKVVRGKNIDLDQVKRRSSGSSIIVSNKDDITWERPPDIPQSVPVLTREIELEFDDLAGQFNGQTAENSNALSRTLGGLKLVSGSANAVQEFDIRIWIDTWATPVLAQIVKLEQYYEHDPVVLGLCGERAQLFQKHGIDKITDDLLEQEITVRVSVGLGAGDPQQRLQKFQSAIQVAMPLLQESEEFKSGEYKVNPDAVMDEVFGAVGYHDGGRRFLTKGPPKPNPMQDLQTQALQAKIEKDKGQGLGAKLTGLAAVAKAALGQKELEADTVDMLLGHQAEAHHKGVEHAHDHIGLHLDAADKGHQHGMNINKHHHERQVAAGQHGLAVAGHLHKVNESNRAHNLNVHQAQHPGGTAEGGTKPLPNSVKDDLLAPNGGDAGTGGAEAPAPALSPNGPPSASPPPPPGGLPPPSPMGAGPMPVRPSGPVPQGALAPGGPVAPPHVGAPPPQPQPMPAAMQPPMAGAASPMAQPPQQAALMQLLKSGQLQFVRDPETGRIAGVKLAGPPPIGPSGKPVYPSPSTAP
jgi:hypothetical protein